MFTQLDDLVTGAPVPKQLGSDRQSPEARRVRARLTRMLRRATEAARRVTDSAGYAAWYDLHGAPLTIAAGESRTVLGGCMSDEGDDWCRLVDHLIGATWRPGYRCHP